jgi:hypothetical protein
MLYHLIKVIRLNLFKKEYCKKKLNIFYKNIINIFNSFFQLLIRIYSLEY